MAINPIDLEVLNSSIGGDINTWGTKEHTRDKATQDKINEIIEVVNETNNFGKLDKGGYEGTAQDLKDDINLKEDKSNKGVANGYAELNSSGKVPLSQMDDSLVGAVEYVGMWDANTNSPMLTPTPTEKGIYYVASVKGSQFGLNFEVGDWIISDGASWGRLDNSLTPEEIQALTFADLTTTNRVSRCD